MSMQTYPLIVGGVKIVKETTRTIYNKYTGEEYAYISIADEEDVKKAVDAAKEAFDTTYFDVQSRYNILSKAAQLMAERADALAEVLVQETGKTLQDAKNEVAWSTDIFIESAEEAKRIHGDTFCMPVPWLDTRTCYTRREPIGIVAAITPFNFPLNLVAHKVAPAIAAGNPVILKPAEYTSVIAYKLCEILLDAGIPRGFLSCLMGSGRVVGNALVENPDISFYSFTGSVPVGKSIKEQIGLRKCTLELGSNAATIVCKDYDIEAAVAACADSAFTNAGQVCIHLQRIYVERDIYEPFVEKMVVAAQNKIVGNPADPATEIGPMISVTEAKRVMEWVDEAKAAGAVVHCGHKRENALVFPTVLTQVTREMKVMQDEVFGPVVSILPFDTMEDAYAQVNDSKYGLNSGILTNNISIAMEAVAKLKTGSVIVGGTCGFRFGCMPYGGIKHSGFGKEGPKYAIEEMTELKAVVILN